MNGRVRHKEWPEKWTGESERITEAEQRAWQSSVIPKNKNKVIGYFCRSLECMRTKEVFPLVSAWSPEEWRGSQKQLSQTRLKGRQSLTPAVLELSASRTASSRSKFVATKYMKGECKQMWPGCSHLHGRRVKGNIQTSARGSVREETHTRVSESWK